MMLAAASASYAPAVRPAARASSLVKMDIATKAGLEDLAVKLNPVVGYWGERPVANLLLSLTQLVSRS